MYSVVNQFFKEENQSQVILETARFDILVKSVIINTGDHLALFFSFGYFLCICILCGYFVYRFMTFIFCSAPATIDTPQVADVSENEISLDWQEVKGIPHSCFEIFEKCRQNDV